MKTRQNEDSVEAPLNTAPGSQGQDECTSVLYRHAHPHTQTHKGTHTQRLARRNMGRNKKVKKSVTYMELKSETVNERGAARVNESE